MMERRDMMQQWLQKALNKIDTMPREELIAFIRKHGLIENEDPMQELVDLTQELGLYDETK